MSLFRGLLRKEAPAPPPMPPPEQREESIIQLDDNLDRESVMVPIRAAFDSPPSDESQEIALEEPQLRENSESKQPSQGFTSGMPPYPVQGDSFNSAQQGVASERPFAPRPSESAFIPTQQSQEATSEAPPKPPENSFMFTQDDWQQRHDMMEKEFPTRENVSKPKDLDEEQQQVPQRTRNELPPQHNLEEKQPKPPAKPVSNQTKPERTEHNYPEMQPSPPPMHEKLSMKPEPSNRPKIQLSPQPEQKKTHTYQHELAKSSSFSPPTAPLPYVAASTYISMLENITTMHDLLETMKAEISTAQHDETLEQTIFERLSDELFNIEEHALYIEQTLVKP